MPQLNKILIFLVFTLGATAVFPQVTGLSKDMLKDLEDELKLSKGFSPGKSFPVANEILPDHYFLGAGDKLSVLIVPQFNIPVTVPVNPDNSIIIPRVNVVLDVSGLTLTRLRDTITGIVTRSNSNSKVHISLEEPKQAVVTMKGNLKSTGVFTLPSSFRVSSAVLVGDKIDQDNAYIPQQSIADYEEKESERNRFRRFDNYGMSSEKIYWTRNVSVIHNDGTSSPVDIERARATGDPAFDPYIKPGDMIIVPYEKESYPTVAVVGEVARPVELPFKKGDMLSHLFVFGGGLSSNADVSNITYISAAGNETNIAVDQRGMPLEDSAVEGGSLLVIGEVQRPKAERPGIVALKGEFRSPGYYQIKEGETLSAIIERAGGLTDKAYPRLGYISRREEGVKSYDQRREYLESFLNSDLTMEDTLRYNIDFLTKKPVVATDFEEAARGVEKVELADGDVVVVPKNPKKVYVFGRVANPGYITFNEGMDLKYYLEKAGGVTETAEEDRIRIIRGNTNVWVEPEEGIIVYAGDQIYVPGPPDIPIIAEQQQGHLYVAISGVLVSLANFIYFVFFSR